MDGRGRGGLVDLAAATVEEELDDVACPRVDLGGRHRRAQPHRAPLRHRDDHVQELLGDENRIPQRAREVPFG